MRSAVRSSLASMLAVAAAAVLAGCVGDILGGREEDPSLCNQTYEFSNFGCARVTGVVTRPGGEPLGGVYVSLHALDESGFDRGEYNTPSTVTDADGRFSIEIKRYGSPAEIPSPDTLTARMQVARVYGHDVYRTDIPVVLHFSPVGAKAVTVTKDVTLVVP